jgi:hypothetical protein
MVALMLCVTPASYTTIWSYLAIDETVVGDSRKGKKRGILESLLPEMCRLGSA